MKAPTPAMRESPDDRGRDNPLRRQASDTAANRPARFQPSRMLSRPRIGGGVPGGDEANPARAQVFRQQRTQMVEDQRHA